MIWVTTQRDLDQIQQRRHSHKTCYLSKLLGSRDLCRKSTFSTLMNLIQSLQPTPFWPKTFLLPQQTQHFRSVLDINNKKKKHRKSTYILKPDDASQGDGIVLVQQASDLRGLAPHQSLVAQHYVANPMLIDRLKYDLRIYVCVTSIHPLKAYCCKEGLVRLATTPYVQPRASNLSKSTMHLTNYSLNKRTKDFHHGTHYNGNEEKESNEDGNTVESKQESKGHTNMYNDGNKRAMSTTLRQVLKDKDKHNAVWQQILQLVAVTLETMHPMLVAAEHSSGSDGSHGSGGAKNFQLLGFDVMLNEEGQPFLLEVNNNPSMSIDAVHPLPPSCSGTTTNSTNNANTDANSTQEGKVVHHQHRQRYGSLCRCMDSHEPHVHRESPVDAWIKQVVLRGAIQLVTMNTNQRPFCGDALPLCLGHCDQVPDEPWYSTVPCREAGGILSRIGQTYRVLMGKSGKWSSYKWRKFVCAVVDGEANEEGEKRSRSSSHEKRETIRLAEEMYRQTRLHAENSHVDATPPTLLFIQLVCNWVHEWEQRKKRKKGMPTVQVEMKQRVDQDMLLCKAIVKACDAFDSSST